MTGVSLCEESDVRIVFATRGDARQLIAQALRVSEPDNALRWIVMMSESLQGEVVDQAQLVRGCGCIVARVERAPEQREKTVGSEAGGDQEPEIRSARDVAAELCN